MHWLFEAKKRFGLIILNFTVTSNHIHLLVYDGKVNIVPKSIQLIAGRTGREYNLRKNRKGAFWEDRYHATAVKTGNHLIRCLAYKFLPPVPLRPHSGSLEAQDAEGKKYNAFVVSGDLSGRLVPS